MHVHVSVREACRVAACSWQDTKCTHVPCTYMYMHCVRARALFWFGDKKHSQTWNARTKCMYMYVFDRRILISWVHAFTIPLHFVHDKTVARFLYEEVRLSTISTSRTRMQCTSCVHFMYMKKPCWSWTRQPKQLEETSRMQCTYMKCTYTKCTVCVLYPLH